MKRLAYLLTLTLVLVSCGTRSGYFKIEGHLLNLNQGEFYVYSPDGVFDGVDTIKVDGGRFTFETPCRNDGTVMIIFPNSSEQPVFAKSGSTVTISGDASHLKEIEVDGTDENKLMNGVRKELVKASPPEVTGIVERFITEHPGSIVSVYLLRRYFITTPASDYNKASSLAGIIYKAQPKNGDVARMLQYADMMKSCSIGSRIPSFMVKDINGMTVSGASLRGKVAVVYTCAEWSYDGRNMSDMLNRLKAEYRNRLTLMAIRLDASKSICRNALRNDSTATITVCDQEMFDSPLLDKFALTNVPDNVVFNAQGVVTDRGLDTNTLETRLRLLLK